MLDLRDLDFVVVCLHLLHSIFNLSFDLIKNFKVAGVLFGSDFVAEILGFLLVLLVDTVSYEVVLSVHVIFETSQLGINVDSQAICLFSYGIVHLETGVGNHVVLDLDERALDCLAYCLDKPIIKLLF